MPGRFPLVAVTLTNDPFCADGFCGDGGFPPPPPPPFDPNTAEYDYFRVIATHTRIMGPTASDVLNITSPWFRKFSVNGLAQYSFTSTTLSCQTDIKWMLPCGDTGAELPWLHNQTINLGCTILNSDGITGGLNTQVVIGRIYLVETNLATGSFFVPGAVTSGFNGLFSGACNTPVMSIEGVFEFLDGTITGGTPASFGGITGGTVDGTVTQWNGIQYPHIQ